MLKQKPRFSKSVYGCFLCGLLAIIFTGNAYIDVVRSEWKIEIGMCVAVDDGDVARLAEFLKQGAHPNDGSGCFDENLLQHAQKLQMQYPEQANRAGIIRALKSAGAVEKPVKL